MAKLNETTVRLYDKLNELVEKGESKTEWQTASQICEFLYGEITFKSMRDTYARIKAVRILLQKDHNRLFYHVENEGYVILESELQHREVIKKQMHCSDAYLMSAKNVYNKGVDLLPQLRNSLTLAEFNKLKNATSLPSGK